MNKYSLTFKDNNLEKLYQSNQLQQLVYPMNLFLNLTGAIYMVTLIIQQTTQEKYSQLFINISTVVVMTGSICLIAKKKQWAQVQLVILNHILMSYQLVIQKDSNPQQTYIIAASSMMAQCITLFVCDFKFAAFNNLTLLIFRLIMAARWEGTEFSQYILIVLVSIIIMFGLYKLNYNTRAYYLSTLRDSQWEHLLPKVVKSEFYLFQLNPEQIKFQVTMSNQAHRVDGYRSFYDFIRSAKVQGGDTLEMYIYKRAKQQLKSGVSMQFQSEETEVEINGKKQFISYSEFQISEMNFMIVLESQKVNQMMIEHQENIKNQLTNFNHFIRQTAKKLHQYVELKDLLKIQTLQIIFFEFQARLKLQTQCIRTDTIDIKQLIQKCSKYFPNLTITLSVEGDMQIQTIKPLFVLMMIHMFKVAKKTIITIQISNPQNPQLIVHGKFDNQALSNDKLFQKALKIIMESFEQYNGCNQYLQIDYNFKIQQNFCFSRHQELELLLRNL